LQESLQIIITLTEDALFLQSGAEKLLAWAAGD